MFDRSSAYAAYSLGIKADGKIPFLQPYIGNIFHVMTSGAAIRGFAALEESSYFLKNALSGLN